MKTNRKYLRQTSAICALCLTFDLASTAAASSVLVDLELSLLIDVSGSVDDNEYSLQRNGYSSAFRNPSVHTALSNGARGNIAVSVIQFDDASYNSIPWTLLSSSSDAIAFADLLDSMARLGSGQTGIGQGINAATTSLTSNNFSGTRLVIDVSGDGTSNSGVEPNVARDAAIAAGVTTINGISIGDPSGDLRTYYEDTVIGGSDAFARDAATFADFETEILAKLIAEITANNGELSFISTIQNATIASARNATTPVSQRLVVVRNGLLPASTDVQASTPSMQGTKSGMSAKSTIMPYSRPKIWEAYGTPFYAEQETDAQRGTLTGGAASVLFPGTESETLGFTFGFDGRLTPEWMLGFAFTASRSDVSVDNFGTSDIDAYYLTPYLSYVRQNAIGKADYFFDLLYSYGSQDYENSGNLGSTSGNTHTVETNTGLKFKSGEFIHGPFIGLRSLTGDIDGVNALPGTDFDSFVTRVGYEVATNVPIRGGVLMPYASVTWEHEYEDRAVVVNNTPVSIVDEDTVVIGLGVAAQYANGWTLQPGYEGRLGSDVTQHFFGLRMGYQF